MPEESGRTRRVRAAEDEDSGPIKAPRRADFSFIIIAALLGSGGTGIVTTALHGDSPAITALTAKIDAMSTKLDKIESSTDTALTTLQDHESRIRSMERRLAKIKESKE